VPDSVKKDVFTSLYFQPRYNRTRNQAFDKVTDRLDVSKLEFIGSDRGEVVTKTNLSIDNLISAR